MKTTFFLLCSLIHIFSADAQTLVLRKSLQPFQINTVFVEDLPEYESTDVHIFGLTLEGQRIPLFSGRQIRSASQLRCYLYMDDTIHTVQFEFATLSHSPVIREFPVRQNPYTVGLFGSSSAPVIRDPSYAVVSSVQQLTPRDIYILQDSEPSHSDLAAAKQLMARGVHILVTNTLANMLGPTIIEKPDPGNGRLLVNAALDPSSLELFLDNRKKELLLDKKRHYDLVAKASFAGISMVEEQPLVFKEMKPEDIAFTIERELFRGRLSPSHKLLLIAFYVPALILIFLIKRGKNLLPAVSFLLLLFVLLSLSNPYPDKMLSISLNPYHLDGETVNLRRTGVSPSRILPSFKFFSPLFEEHRFTAQDCSATTWKLNYTALHSNSRQISVHHFGTTDPVKFNQIPHIQLVEGSYFIQYTNPLRAWSLHEPK
jgi:hypothetical protein